MRFPIPSGLAVALLLAPCGITHAQTPATPTSRMLVEAADLSGLALSPDGRTAAFREERASIERNTYDSVWQVVGIDDGGPPLRIADGGVPLKDSGGMPTNEHPQWSPDSAWIYYRAMFDDQIQVWRASRTGDHVERVTSDPADVKTFLVDPRDGTLVYETRATRQDVRAAEENEFDRGILIDGSIMALQNLYRSTWLEGRLVSERGRPDWTKASLLADAPARYRSVDLRTLEVSEASDVQIADLVQSRDGPDERFRSALAFAPSPSGDRYAVLTPVAGRAGPEVQILDPTHSAPIASCSACRDLIVQGVAWRSGDALVLTVRDATKGFGQSLYAWRPADDTLRLIASSDGLLNGFRFHFGGDSCAIGRWQAICVTASANRPPRLERIDLETGDRRVLHAPNAALAEAAATIPSELLTWTDPDGRRFTGQLFTPPSRGPGERVPLVIDYYICPGFLRGGLGDEAPLLALASAGIATLCINHQATPRDSLADYEIGRHSIATIIGILSERGLVDETAVGMTGLSFGSEVVIWTAAHSDLLAAASVASPFPTPTWYWTNALRPGWTENAMAQWGLGAPDETPERWDRMSPARYFDRIKAPLLLQLPEEEYRAALDYYVPMVRSGAATEMYAFPQGLHWKFLPRQKLATYERNLDWFRFWLQDYHDPDPRKTDQYRRWRQMRAMREAAKAAATLN
jgi:dipeptidyl aminopeptidase/acylaminoacyl peptidase